MLSPKFRKQCPVRVVLMVTVACIAMLYSCQAQPEEPPALMLTSTERCNYFDQNGTDLLPGEAEDCCVGFLLMKLPLFWARSTNSNGC